VREREKLCALREPRRVLRRCPQLLRNSQMSDSFARALLFVRQGRYREAESYLRIAIQHDPEDPQGFFFLATCLMHDPNTRSEALSMIDQALRLRPTRAFYHAQRA